MDREQIALRLKDYFERDHRRQGMALTNTTNLLEEWFLDSLAIVETVLFLERSFGAKFTGSDINGSSFKNIEALTELVFSRLQSPDGKG